MNKRIKKKKEKQAIKNFLEFIDCVFSNTNATEISINQKTKEIEIVKG